MTTEPHHEDLMVWQKAHALSLDIHRCTSGEDFDHLLRDELRNAAVRIVMTIVQGYERDTAAEFAEHLSQALGACAVLRSQLHVAYELKFLSHEDFRRLHRHAVRTAEILQTLHIALKRTRPF